MAEKVEYEINLKDLLSEKLKETESNAKHFESTNIKTIEQFLDEVALMQEKASKKNEEQDAILLSNFLKDKNMNVKFLFYNEKESIDYHASNKEKISIFRKYLDKYSIVHEYYIPPGIDIGSSCGMFLMDTYLENDGKLL